MALFSVRSNSNKGGVGKTKYVLALCINVDDLE